MRRLWLAGGDDLVPDDSWELAETIQQAMGSIEGHVPHVLSVAPGTHGCAGLLGWCHRERCWPLQEIRLRVGEPTVSPSAYISADSARASGFSRDGEWRWTRPAPVPARQAYERTSVEVDGLPALIPGEPVPAEALARGAYHVITAHNPAGLQYSPQANDRAHALLLESIDAPDYARRGAVGRPIDSDHPDKQSVALLARALRWACVARSSGSRTATSKPPCARGSASAADQARICRRLGGGRREESRRADSNR